MILVPLIERRAGLTPIAMNCLNKLRRERFCSEPVHNLVHRLVLETMESPSRDIDLQTRTSEFLASTDNWFRPVQVRTGPDGALWIVDMYRYLIEHPRWIPPSQLSQIDVRAGDDKGRVYRVYPKGKKLRVVPNYSTLDSAALVASLDTPNGTSRDMIHWNWFGAVAPAVAPLQSLFREPKIGMSRKRRV
jgi:hypothetical protein